MEAAAACGLRNITHLSRAVALAAWEVPDYDGTEYEDAAPQFASLLKEAEAFEAHAQKRIKEINGELARLEKDLVRGCGDRGYAGGISGRVLLGGGAGGGADVANLL